MKKIVKNLFNYKSLEFIGFFLILIWCISPITFYFMQQIDFDYRIYLKVLIYIIGVYGYLFFIITKIKNCKEERKKIISWQTLKNNVPNLLIFLMLFWAVFSTFFALDKHIAIFGENYRNEGLIVYFAYAGFIFLNSVITNKKYFSYILKSIIFTCIVLVTLPLFKVETINSIISGGFTNIFYNQNHYGYYLLIATMLALFNFVCEKNFFKQIVFLITYAYLNYFLIVNNTFGVYLAFLITIIFLLVYAIIKKWNVKKNILVVGIFVLMSCFVTDIKGNNVSKNNLSSFFSDVKTVMKYESKKKIDEPMSLIEETKMNKVGSSRMILWKSALDLIKKHPVVGGGIESLNEYYLSNDILQDRPHNTILQFASFIGIPGAILYLILIFYVAIYNLKNIFKSKDDLNITVFFTAMSYFISSMFGNSMYYTAPYYLIVLGILIYFINGKKVS